MCLGLLQFKGPNFHTETNLNILIRPFLCPMILDISGWAEDRRVATYPGHLPFVHFPHLRLSL